MARFAMKSFEELPALVEQGILFNAYFFAGAGNGRQDRFSLQMLSPLKIEDRFGAGRYRCGGDCFKTGCKSIGTTPDNASSGPGCQKVFPDHERRVSFWNISERHPVQAG